MRVLILAAVVMSLSSCNTATVKGHVGEPIRGAIEVEVLPTDGWPATFAGPGARTGNPFIHVHNWIKNVSEEVVCVRACSADAIDETGERLFPSRLASAARSSWNPVTR